MNAKTPRLNFEVQHLLGLKEAFRSMTSQTVRLQTKGITDWDSFHSVFAETMGFPKFYGRNMNAWIDCMTGFDDGMTRFTVLPGELFHLEVVDTKDFAQRLPEIFQAFISWVPLIDGAGP